MSIYQLNEFLVKRDEEVFASPLETARPSKSYRSSALRYFHDCPTLVSKLNQKLYNKEDKVNLVEEYNSCKH